MKNFILAAVVLVGLNAKAEFILCTSQRLENQGKVYDVPEINIETSQKTMLLKDNLNLGHSFFSSSVISSGEYKSEIRLSTENKFVFDVTSTLDYPCNYQNAFMSFDLTSDALDVNVKCDGAPLFSVVSLKLNCIHY